MPQEHKWPESHAEQTDVLPTVSAHAGATTEAFARPAHGGQQPQRRGASKARKAGIIGGAVVGVLALLYGIDLLVSQGSVPRGVHVAGVDVGGMDRDEAEAALRTQIEPRLTQPVEINAGDVRTEIAPKSAGLSLDWPATLEQAGDQPLNPITRITSFFTDRELGVITDAEPNQLETAMAALSDRVAHDPVEGTIRFEGATPIPVLPVQGQELKTDAATEQVLTHWASGGPLRLPVEQTPVKTTAEGVRTAMEQVAKPAVSGPVLVRGEGKDGTLEPEEIAAGLTFQPGENGSLTPKIDKGAIVDGVGPELKSTETEAKDAKIVFEGGRPTVEPSVEGNGINWDKSLAPLLDVLKRTDDRELKALYEKQPAQLTTEQANGLGITEVIGEFTTTGFAPDSGVNIRRVAEEVNGAVVEPGGTFSLNGHTGPRGTAQGYIPAGIIENGAPGEAVGGGISQFATTLYNASYFAGMKDAGHTEHSYYISRYPAAREATVFQRPDGTSVIDLRFTNDAKTGVAIQTVWTPSSITVKIWGTKRYDVESIPGERTNFTDPGVRKGPPENCQPSSGGRGFTTSDTRVLRDADTGQVVRREPHTVVYDSHPKIVCE